MGIGRFIKKTFLVLGLCGSMAYLGDKYNFNDRVVYPRTLSQRKVEADFYNPLEIQKKIVINNNGNLETYLVSNDVEIPVLKGTKGPILALDYELRNLTQSQLYSAVVQSWDSLTQEQRNVVASNEVERVLSERYKELEDVLKEFFIMPGGGD